MSRSFALGKMIVVNPALCALKDFSFTPPIGNTLPRSVISPVIPTSRRIGRFVKADTSAVAIVTPAEGPSFGTAPSGTWIWISLDSWKLGLILKSTAFERTYDMLFALIPS